MKVSITYANLSVDIQATNEEDSFSLNESVDQARH
jgi:hypothetical protein